MTRAQLLRELGIDARDVTVRREAVLRNVLSLVLMQTCPVPVSLPCPPPLPQRDFVKLLSETVSSETSSVFCLEKSNSGLSACSTESAASQRSHLSFACSASTDILPSQPEAPVEARLLAVPMAARGSAVQEECEWKSTGDVITVVLTPVTVSPPPFAWREHALSPGGLGGSAWDEQPFNC